MPPNSIPTVIVKLSRLNKILHYSDELGTITIEPGVTFAMIQQTLNEQGNHWVFNSFGGSKDASVIANTLERGLGPGLIGEKILHACEMEVLLPDGTLLKTGFEKYGKNFSSGIFRSAPGPSLEGLFCQSSFGIITKMTFFLAKRPKHFQLIALRVEKWEEYPTLMLGIRELKRNRVFEGFLPVYNIFRALPYKQTPPWDQFSFPLSLETALKIAKKYHLGTWNTLIPLFAFNKLHLKAQKKAIKEVFRGNKNVKLISINPTILKFSKLIDPIHKFLYGISLHDQLEPLLNKSFYLGNLLDNSIASVYWRKKPSYGKNLNPDKDKVGLWWMSVIVPFQIDHLQRAVDTIKKIQTEHLQEPGITFQVVSDKAIILILSHCWDREKVGEDDHAMKVYDILSDTLHNLGYMPYRLGLHSMKFTHNADDSWEKIIKDLKLYFDSNHIYSVGRYDQSNT